jgi:pimeloyl-ACP methyl ester carboxylesterase
MPSRSGATKLIESIEVRANGVRFHVLEEGGGHQSKRLALCLHGFPELGYSWRHQLPLLARLGYRAWAPDLRGYGKSERPPRTSSYAIEALVEDVVGLIEAGGRGPATLIAHDWGAIIAWYVAMRRPELLERLVIMNVPHPAVLARELRNPRQLFQLLYAGVFQIPRLPERLLARDQHRQIDNAFVSTAVDPARFTDADLREYRDAASQPGALTAMLAYYRAYVRGGGMRRQRRLGYPIIDVPTLMIWGERDAFLRKETTIGTSAWVRDLTVRYLPDAAHWVQQEAPEAVNAILETWLTGASVPEAWELTT